MMWLAPAAVVMLAVVAELVLSRVAGGGQAAFFLGRFHPLVVHLPIGFFLLVALAEAATFHPRLRDRVEPVLGLLLPLSAAAALAAFLMGQLLALEGGFPAAALGWHRRLTLIAVIGIAACWVVFDRQRNGGATRWLYRGLLGATLGVLSLGAHFGGSMTRGDTYLSKYAPGPLKFLLGGAEPKVTREPTKAPVAVSDPVIFQDVILPILTKRCVSCHGAEKQKGKLRLDSLELLLKGGENGEVVKTGLPAKSPLLLRTLLPIDDDDRMPPEGKPTLDPAERALIEFWIERGAPAALKVRDALAPVASRAILEHSLLGDSAVPATALGAPSSSASAAPTASAAPGAAVLPTDAPSASAAAPPTAVPEASPPSTPASTAAAPGSAVASSGPGVLAAHCVKCHGPDKQKGKLRVDSLAALLKGGSDGPALVPGNPEKSSIVARLRLPLSSDDHMPPRKESQLTATEIAVRLYGLNDSDATGSPCSALG